MHLSHHRYVALKVYTRQKSQMNRELETYEHLRKLDSSHPGQAYLRGVYDTFEICSTGGYHVCLVHPPLHMTVSALQKRGLGQRYNELLLRETLLRLFRALDFLHTEADVVHTGKLENRSRSPAQQYVIDGARFPCRYQGNEHHAYH
jgi:hypothetical protein